MTEYVVIELPKNGKPKVNGVFHTRDEAEKAAYRDSNEWRNIIEREVGKLYE